MGYRKSVTLKDLSTKTGYSTTTISHAINNTRPVDIKTRKFILEKALELGYITQKSLKQNSNLIGLILPDISTNIFSRIANKIVQIGNQFGYEVLIINTNSSEKMEDKFIYSLIELNVSGIILASCKANLSQINMLKNNNIPTILIDRDTMNQDFDFIGIDNFKNSYTIVKETINKGLKKIAYVGYLDQNFTVHERYQGYKVAMSEFSFYRDDLDFKIDHRDLEENTDITNFLEANNDIECVFCVASKAAYYVLSHYLDRNMKIPIITFDDEKWYSLINYPLTVISQPIDSMAKVAIDSLINKISKTWQYDPLKKVILDCQIKNYTSNG